MVRRGWTLSQQPVLVRDPPHLSSRLASPALILDRVPASLTHTHPPSLEAEPSPMGLDPGRRLASIAPIGFSRAALMRPGSSMEGSSQPMHAAGGGVNTSANR